MTRDEAWVYAVDYAVPPGSLEEKAILRVLENTGGNVSQALAMTTRVTLWSDEKPQYGGDTLASALRNGGMSGKDIRVDKGFSTSSRAIEVWFQEGQEHFFRDPDIKITWREVFEFVKAGRKRVFQASMFDAIGDKP